MFPAFTAITAHQILSSSRRTRSSYSPPKRLPVARRQVQPSEHPLGCRCAEKQMRQAQATAEMLQDFWAVMRRVHGA